jgi:hypothetical protein
MRAKEFITETETYQPPELKTGDVVMKGKFKNSPAEIKGFKKDKHNQPVLKTNKGDVQLFKPRITKLMNTNEETVNELDYADDVGALTLSDEELLVNAKVVSDFDNREVYLFQDSMQKVFFFVGKNCISAFVALDTDNNLRGIKNITGEGGLVTALITCIAHKLKQPIVILDTEQLTEHGIGWLVSLLKVGGRGLTITDQTGKYPHPAKVHKEWLVAKNTGKVGPTRITIESKMTRHFRSINENTKYLMFPLWVIGSKELL